MDNSDTSYPAGPQHWKDNLAGSDTGFVFAATGAKYTALAHQAAASVRKHHPLIPIDLFTDQNVENDLYDQVHQLSGDFFRPKFEAISRSRFERTVYLDTDLVVVADVSDLFWILNKYDVAAAHVSSRNAGWATEVFRSELPNVFPQINSGVMAIRKNDRTTQLMRQVEAAIKDFDLKMDQIALRELIWLSDVSLYILPGEYNVRESKRIAGLSGNQTAPRILHSSKFHKQMRGSQPPSPRAIYGAWALKTLRYSLARDKQLAVKPVKSSLMHFLRS